MDEIAELLRAERLALIELLETLAPDEWAAPSLCGGWTVQDVAAHVAWMPALSPAQAARELARRGFRINAMIAQTAHRWSARGTGAILEQLHTTMRTGALPVGASPRIGLADAVIHQLDIRRPLARPRPIAEAAFVAVAELQLSVRWPSTIVVGGSARRRVRGMRLVAEDSRWTFGEGAEVRGSREALLLMLTNRPFRQGELVGPGVARLGPSR
jgi:uncharacterized protein (TIGR03083 family)